MPLRTGLSAAKGLLRPGIHVLMLSVAVLPARAQSPPPCADSVRQALIPLVGTWDVRTVFRSGQAWDTSFAAARIELDFHGCLLREELDGTRNTEPFHALSFWGAVGLHGPIQRTFVHSQHGLLTVYSGRQLNGVLVLRDSQVVGGQLAAFEHRFEPFGADSMRFTSRRSTDGGATWIVTWFADYRRRAQ